jgi:hypothetical protein
VAGQATVAAVSVLRTFAIPLMLGADLAAYAQWQTYLLYLAYVSIAFLGVNDGMYLRHPRWERSTLAARFTSSIGLYVVVLALEAGGLAGLAYALGWFETVPLVGYAVLANIPIVGMYGYLQYHLQLTGRIESSSKALVAEKVLFIVGVVAVHISRGLDLPSLVLLDVGAKVVVVAYLLYVERPLLRSGSFDVGTGLREFRLNVASGSKVMVGAYAALLFMGVGRIVVQVTHPAEVFAKFAFAVSVSMILLLGGQAVAAVIYPRMVLLRTDEVGLALKRMQNLTLTAFPLALACYVPVAYLVRKALPAYVPEESVLALVFVATVLQVVLSVVNNTMYRVLRHEGRMLTDNLFSLAVLVPVVWVLRYDITAMLLGQLLLVGARLALTQFRFESHLGLRHTRTMVGLLLWSVAFGISVQAGVAFEFLFVGAALVWLFLRRRQVRRDLAR